MSDEGHSAIGASFLWPPPEGLPTDYSLHRHAMFVNQKTEDVFVPLNSLSSTHKLELANSSLSEFAVLGVSSFKSLLAL